MEPQNEDEFVTSSRYQGNSREVINKEIHMIWFGDAFGPQLMPQDKSLESPITYMENLIEIAERNPSYQVYLWTDKNSVRVFGKEKPSNINVINFDDASNERVAILKSIPNSEELIEKINIFRGPFYNSEAASKNLGAASDILRAMILLKFGGIYVDADSLFLIPLTENIGLFNSICLGGDDKCAKLGLGDLSNDVIAVTRNESPELSLYLELINKYLTPHQMKDILMAPNIDEETESVAKGTTEIFGPRLMRLCVLGKLLIQKDQRDYLDNGKSFGKNIADFGNLLPKSTDPLSRHQQYRQYVFPLGFFMRGQANSWLTKRKKAWDPNSGPKATSSGSDPEGLVGGMLRSKSYLADLMISSDEGESDKNISGYESSPKRILDKLSVVSVDSEKNSYHVDFSKDFEEHTHTSGDSGYSSLGSDVSLSDAQKDFFTDDSLEESNSSSDDDTFTDLTLS